MSQESALGAVTGVPAPLRTDACVMNLLELGKLVLRGTRIVVPQKLREQILDLAHEGHQGVVRTKQRLRSKVWWPGVDRAIEGKCKVCRGC